MDIVDMYNYYRLQYDGLDDFHFDYCDHDGFSYSDNHLDEIFYCKDNITPYVERRISSDLNRVMFYIIEYLSHLEELNNITIKFEVNTEFFGFHSHSISDFTIYFLSTVDENYCRIYNTDLSLKMYNTD